MRVIHFTVPADRDGISVGTFLRRDCRVSARLVSSLKHHEMGISVAGVHIRTVDKLHAGDVLRIELLERPSDIEPVSMPLSIRYEDEDLLIVDKPPGMPVHPVHGHVTDTLANAVSSYLANQGEASAFRSVGRLDRDTTGLTVICKNSYAASLLQTSIDKVYYAVCEGELSGSGRIDAPIRHKEGFGIRREIGEGGLPCVTNWRALGTFNGHTLLEITLETGRTHQIRTHFAEYFGMPLAGDDMYGGRLDHITRQALHCGKVSFTHPITQERMDFSADLPEDMQKIIHNAQ